MAHTPTHPSVERVKIDGDLKVQITPGLHATISANQLITAKLRLPLTGNPQAVVKQVHSGTGSGTWKVDGNTLLPASAWSGGLRATGTYTFAGRIVPLSYGGDFSKLSSAAVIFACEPGTLKLTVSGVSPFVLLFH